MICVTGLGRSGTSLVMRMLHMGGCPVWVSNHVSYERTDIDIVDREMPWLNEVRGKAFKQMAPPLDPARAATMVERMGTKEEPYRWIYCRRNALDCAASHAKFQRVLGMEHRPDQLRRLMFSIHSDNASIPTMISKLRNSRVLIVDFEDIIRRPDYLSKTIAKFVGCCCTSEPLDAQKMAGEIKPRHPACYPGFLENDLAKERGETSGLEGVCV